MAPGLDRYLDKSSVVQGRGLNEVRWFVVDDFGHVVGCLLAFGWLDVGRPQYYVGDSWCVDVSGQTLGL